jgi:uncharacterized protein YwgA
MIKKSDIVFLIAFFGFYNSKVRGRTRVQKDICILKHDDKIPFNFKFEPNYYGPYSYELTDTVDTLVAAGLLEQNITHLSSGDRRYDYSLTEEGKELFRKIKMTPDLRNSEMMTRLTDRIKKLRKMSIPEVTDLAKKCSGIQSTV